MEQRECWLTTIDNPFDPFEESENWRNFDQVENSYATNSYIMRIALISDLMTEEEVLEEIERACDEIIKYDFMNIYRKVIKGKRIKEGA